MAFKIGLTILYSSSLFFKRTVKTPVKLHRCSSCSQSSLSAYTLKGLDTLCSYSTICYKGDNFYNLLSFTPIPFWGWQGEEKVSCIMCHRGVQLRLAYNWARPAILAAGKGSGGMFLFLLFLHFHSCSSFFLVSLSSPLLALFSLSGRDDTKWSTRVDVSLNPTQ